VADLLDLAAVALLLPLLGGAIGGAAVRTATVTSAVWAAAAAPVGAVPPGGGLPLVWDETGQPATAHADVVATGTLPLGGVVLRLEASSARDVGAATVTACLGGAWDGATCDGQAVLLGTLTDRTPVAVTLAPGARLALRATAPRNAASRTVFTLHVEVPREAARAAEVRTS